jgi:3-hydroxyisobutyrate dehydrogenase-like beta-hydroxyacid dehydrogenase
MSVVGLLHPGEMGAAIGGALVDAGHLTLWVSKGRSRDTAARAQAAGLTDAGMLSELTSRAEVLISICPPQFARELADQVAATGWQGIYVDANAIAPSSAERIKAQITTTGARFLDGSIVGPPPTTAATTRLFLSGPDAGRVALLFAGTTVEVVQLDGSATAASALKAAYAGWTKASLALLLAARALARHHGVEQDLQQEWGRSLPQLDARLQHAAAAASSKGWRWSPEMSEIATAMGESGLPRGFHEAAAAVFASVPRGTEGSPENVLGELLGGTP